MVQLAILMFIAGIVVGFILSTFLRMISDSARRSTPPSSRPNSEDLEQ